MRQLHLTDEEMEFLRVTARRYQPGEHLVALSILQKLDQAVLVKEAADANSFFKSIKCMSPKDAAVAAQGLCPACGQRLESRGTLSGCGEWLQCSGCSNIWVLPVSEKAAIDTPPDLAPLIGADALLFSYNDVKAALCDACRLGVPESFSLDIGTNSTHHLNGTRIPCTAHAWRGNRSVHAKTFPNELTS